MTEPYRGERDVVLVCRSAGTTETFTLDTRSLTFEWKSPESSGKQVWALGELSPELERRAGRASASAGEGTLGVGVALVGLGVVFYFSAVQPLVPLLAPFLALAGLIPIARWLRDRRPMEISVINKKNGEPARWIDHGACAPDALRAFESELRSRVGGGTG